MYVGILQRKSRYGFSQLKGAINLPELVYWFGKIYRRSLPTWWDVKKCGDFRTTRSKKRSAASARFHTAEVSEREP